MFRRVITPITIMIVACLLASATPAAAAKRSKPPKQAATTLSFSVADKDVDLGDTAAGTAVLRMKSGRSYVAVAGATLSVYLDNVLLTTTTTDAAGSASIEATAASAGSHVLKVIYAGDATHKPARRAQGFDVHDTWYSDTDDDGYGDAASPQRATSQPEGTVEDDTDCDDADAAVNPAAVEDETNAIDDDCDGEVDEVA